MTRNWLSNRPPTRNQPIVKAQNVWAYWLEFSDTSHSGWYFYDETGADAYGPYETEEAAVAGEKEYNKFLWEY